MVIGVWLGTLAMIYFFSQGSLSGLFTHWQIFMSGAFCGIALYTSTSETSVLFKLRERREDIIDQIKSWRGY